MTRPQDLYLPYKAATLAYYGNDEMLDSNVRAFLGNGWDIIASSNSLPNCKEFGFRGVAFLNLEENKVIIACSGTRIGDEYDTYHSIYDIAADLKVSLGLIPRQFHDDAIQFIDYVYNFIDDIGIDVEYITTGHSLGGVNAQLLGVYLLSKGANISSITFDQPGTLEMMKEFEKTYGIDLDLDVIKDNFTVVNSNSPNFVNSFGKQFGNVYKAQTNIANEESIFRSPSSQIKEHSLDNFTMPLLNNAVYPEPNWNIKYAFNTDYLEDIGQLVYGTICSIYYSYDNG